MISEDQVVEALQTIEQFCMTSECEKCALYDHDRYSCILVNQDKRPSRWYLKAQAKIVKVEI